MKPSPRIRSARPVAALAVFAACLFLPPLAPGASAQGRCPPEAARDVAHRLHDALASGDSARALELLADGARIYEGGHAETRAEYRAGHLAVDIEFAGAVDRERLAEHVQTAGSEVALYLSEYRTSGSFRGEEIDSHGTETLVLECRPEGWRIVHVHWSSR